jgi:hypothetical protein
MYHRLLPVGMNRIQRQPQRLEVIRLVVAEQFQNMLDIDVNKRVFLRVFASSQTTVDKKITRPDRYRIHT